MRIGIAILAVVLAGCGEVEAVPANSSEVADAGASFPVKGEYHRTSDRTVGDQLQRMETDGPLSVSTREELEQFVAGVSSNCRDRQVDIGGGSFSAKVSCDGGTYGEYTVVTHGSYSKDSFDITHERTSDKGTAVETVSYRLKG